jgi:peroxiredoxin Q/BCP
MTLLAIGEQAPEITARRRDGSELTLSSLRGRQVLVYFYPKDDTPGCTAEACDFRDKHASFDAAGAEVLGISSDSVASHEGFADKHRLPMKLLSDRGGHVRALYGVKSTLGILPGRVTYVIDKQGVVRYVFDSQLRATAHVSKALDFVKTLASEGGATRAEL